MHTRPTRVCVPRIRLIVFPPAVILMLLIGVTGPAQAAAYHNPYGKLPTNATAGDRAFADYFRRETRRLADQCLADVQTAEDWTRTKERRRQELRQMLGLDPLPARTDLKAVTTGKIDHPEFTVERIHFQSRPGLYVTANLFLPRKTEGPAPAILYLCGHSLVMTNGISCGNKIAYQHHGIWFARQGYVCLVLDTVQLGEIEGIHHGTYREGMWWWNSRGYSSAAAEAWNAVRALDYLETRPEVDKQRFGVTGRSGGGAGSWWIAALDERIQAACPVAGITDLQNHVVDGTVEGHCDCMFLVNTYRWDYPAVAALVSPRPLLICNTDKDTIFPLDGVVRLHEKVRRIYDLEGAGDRLGLLITEGPHHDTQDLQVPVLRWFDRFLKKQTRLVTLAAEPMFSPLQLRVFDVLPTHQITRTCYEHFTQLAEDVPALPADQALAELRRKTFGGWPAEQAPPRPREVRSLKQEGVQLTVYEFESQPGVLLRFYVARPASSAPTELRLEVLDEPNWMQALELLRPGFSNILGQELALVDGKAGRPPSMTSSASFAAWARDLREHQTACVLFAPRGVGASASGGDARYLVQLRRRFMLLGQTLAGMQAWDARRAVEAVRQEEGLNRVPLHLQASPQMTEVATFAALFEPGVASLTLCSPPRPDQQAADFLNWSRIVTSQQLLALAQASCRIIVPAGPAGE